MQWLSGCQLMQKIENWKKPKRHAMYAHREKAQRRQQRHKERLNQQNKEYNASHPEQVKEWRQNRFNRIKDEVVTCPVCNYETKK